MSGAIETIEADIDGVLVRVRRPTLLGAVLIKARAILVHDDPVLMAPFPPPRVQRARLAYRLLVA